jgi:ATP-dependent DNA ligase
MHKVMLATMLAPAAPGLRFIGIVSKRKDSHYNAGRSPHWIKNKNPNAPAVKREAEEDRGNGRPAEE